MDPTSLLNLARFVQADPPPFLKPPLPKIEIPKIDPLPPIAPEPLPKPPVSLLWRKLLGYVPVVRFYYAGQAIAEFLDDARDMYDDAMAVEQEKAYQTKLVDGAKVYHASLGTEGQQWETTCYWNCVDRNGADNCLKPEFVEEGSRPKRDDFGELVRKGDEEIQINPNPSTVQNGQTGIPRIVASADETPTTPAASAGGPVDSVATTSADDDLYRKLEQAWDSTTNMPIPSDVFDIAPQITLEGLQKLSAVLDVLIISRLNEGKTPKDVVVCVAGHGAFTQTIELLLRKGVTVVSREKWPYQDVFSSPKNASRFKPSIDEGRLILSPVGLQSHPMPYDVVIWEHPLATAAATEFQPTILLSLPESIRADLVMWGQLPEGLKDDGLLVVQTDVPSYFIKHLLESRDAWRVRFGRPISRNNYLFPTDYAEPSSLQTMAFLDKTSAVAILQHIPSPATVLDHPIK